MRLLSSILECWSRFRSRMPLVLQQRRLEADEYGIVRSQVAASYRRLAVRCLGDLRIEALILRLNYANEKPNALHGSEAGSRCLEERVRGLATVHHLRIQEAQWCILEARLITEPFADNRNAIVEIPEHSGFVGHGGIVDAPVYVVLFTKVDADVLLKQIGVELRRLGGICQRRDKFVAADRSDDSPHVAVRALINLFLHDPEVDLPLCRCPVGDRVRQEIEIGFVELEELEPGKR